MFVFVRRATSLVLATVLGLAIPVSAQQTPASPSVVSVGVSGNAHVPSERILAVVKTKQGDPFDPKVVEEDLRAINDLGFFADQAPPLIKQRPDGIAVTFRVIENPVISRITFNGNAHVPSETLLALMDSATGQVFNTNTFHQDVLKINSYYDKIGYGGQVSNHVNDLKVDPSGVISVAILEGLTVRKIIIDGDHILAPNIIIAALATKTGQPFSDETRDKDYVAIKALYAKYDLSVGDFDAGIDPATADPKTGAADVRYNINVARVGAVQITGNTKTHDDVIRRELRLRPGQIITESGVRRDYDRLNSLGFFEKVELNTKPGPDPKKAALVTLDWNVKEQRTGTAQVGAGYSGGITGQGLTGTVSYSENNINGTGDGASVRVERGSRTSDAQLSLNIPYFGKTEKSQKYSLGTTIFTNQVLNFYPVYAVPAPAPSPGSVAPTPIPIGAPQGVALVPTNVNSQQLGGIVSNYQSRSNGISVTVGRRFSDYLRTSIGANIQQVASAASLPTGYYFASSSTALGSFNTGNSSTNPFGSNTQVGGGTALGVLAPSIANIDSTKPYNLRSLVFGLASDTRNNLFNPRTGNNLSLSEEVSGRGLGSDFNYSILTLDASRFFPVLKNATFGVRGKAIQSTGAIPPNRLATFSDQDLRGYRDPFYGTDALLFQSELRIPLTPDAKFSIATFAETGGTRIRGGTGTDLNGNSISLNKYTFHSDIGVGLRFDVPQLGLHTIRLDFARGSQGAHTAFGIGQSF